MKVILKKDVKSLGKKDQSVEVAEGYARNYLFPRDLAVAANQGNLKNLKQKKASQEKKEEKIIAEAKALASKLEKLTVDIATKVGEGGRLYGSVTTKEIVQTLNKNHGIKLDKRKIETKEPIKGLGVTNVTIKLHPEVQAEFKVNVIEK